MDTEEQDIIAAQLDAERLADRVSEEGEIKKIKEEGKSFGSPSFFKYFLLFSLAIIIDLFGFVDLTGIGWVIGKFITIPCFLLSLTICLLTGTKQKEAQNFIDNLGNRIHQIGFVGRNTIKQTAKFIGRNPTILIAIGEGLDIVLPPFISLINLSTLWVYIAYRGEKRAYQHAQETAESI